MLSMRKAEGKGIWKLFVCPTPYEVLNDFKPKKVVLKNKGLTK